MRDLVVAGGGPVGMAAALHARRLGLDVELREPRTGPIDKACGEGLMPGAVAELRALGIEPDGHELSGIRYVDGSSAVAATATFRTEPGRGVRRTVLHDAMSERLRAEGVSVRHEPVQDVRDAGSHVVVDGEPTRHLVAADGLHSPVRRALGLDVPVPGRARFGLRRHVAQAPWSSYVEVHWSPRAEAYVTPVAADLVGVALLVPRGLRFDEAMADFPVLRSRLTGETTRVMGAGPLRQGARARVSGRVLLAGDAGGYVDALTGEGIAVGLAQARAAASCIAAGRVDDYERLAARIARRHELLTRALLRSTSYALPRRLLVPAARRLPWVFETAVNELARPVRVPGPAASALLAPVR